jgi:hypothetical protein
LSQCNLHNVRLLASKPITRSRGTVVDLGPFALLRIVLERESGGVGVTDRHVTVLIADAAQNAMADNDASAADGLLLVGTIGF